MDRQVVLAVVVKRYEERQQMVGLEIHPHHQHPLQFQEQLLLLAHQ